MDTSFYTAARGARTQQERMNVISNNIANINTYGYKEKTAVFQDLIYYNLRAPEEEDTKLKAGAGIRVERTDTNFDPNAYMETEGSLDYAIEGEGFFALRDPMTGEYSFTRDGRFQQSLRGDGFYLVTEAGKFVVDKAGNPIKMNQGEPSAEMGIYTFQMFNGMLSSGNNEFTPVEKNGIPILMENAKLKRGYLEMSNVDFADQMSKTIETARAYSYNLKMVKTADEVEEIINTLR